MAALIGNKGFSASGVLDRLQGFVVHYSKWKVGTATNPFTRRTETGTPDGWRFWLMNTPMEAQFLVRVLQRQGMSLCGFSDLNARYIYIYPTDSELFASGELIHKPQQIASR